jgi:hypothetical protein
MKTKSVVALLSGTLILLSGCGAPLTAKTSEPGTQTSTEVASESPTEATSSDTGTFENPFAFGSLLSNDKVEIKLAKTEVNVDRIVASANMFNDAAPKGQQYVRVLVTIKNIGNEKVRTGDLTLAIIAATGESYSTAFVAGGSDGELNALSDVDPLYHGGTGNGYVYFLVPKGIVDGAIYSVSFEYSDEIFIKAN